MILFYSIEAFKTDNMFQVQVLKLLFQKILKLMVLLF